MLAVGDHAPHIELVDIDGERHSLGKRLTLVVFFKTTCPTCQYSWPFYGRLARIFEAGLQVLGISQHNAARTRDYRDEFGGDFPLLIDGTLGVSNKYDPEFVPTAFLIDAQGKIVSTLVSWNREEMTRLNQEIADRLRVQPQPLFQPSESVISFKPG